MNVAILGAGSWGSALSLVLSDNNHKVSIYHYNNTLKVLFSTSIILKGG